jgi:hypothetical protein
MLETPLFGRFHGENKRLVFSPPAPYHVLVRGTTGFGVFALIYGLGSGVAGYDVAYFYPQWWLLVGTLTTAAGVLAALSLQSISFDLQERHYRRRQGPGMFPKGTYGSLNDLDAVVLIAEPNSRLTANGVTYHLVLHWKNQKEPLMVLQQDTRQVRNGQPLNYAAAQLLQAGMAYARALGVPFYDNSHFPSKCPVTIWQ